MPLSRQLGRAVGAAVRGTKAVVRGAKEAVRRGKEYHEKAEVALCERCARKCQQYGFEELGRRASSPQRSASRVARVASGSTMTPRTKLRVEDLDDQSAFETTWGAFAADNAEDEEVLELVGGLAPGEHVTLGGGAQPRTKITRAGKKK